MSTQQMRLISIALPLVSVACGARRREPRAPSASDVAAIQNAEGKWVLMEPPVASVPGLGREVRPDVLTTQQPRG